MSRFPTDTLALIFQHLEPCNLSSSLLVCRAWKEAVIPILYRHLIVSSPDQVHKLAVTVAMAHPLSSHVSKYTRAIEICDDISLELDSPHYSSHMVPHNSICMVECSTPAITNNLLAVLMQTMNLRKVVIAGLLGPSAMAVISRITALTITCLTLNITDYMALRGMVYIADFTHLQTLQIESILKEERISNELPTMLRPWLMPHLYTLTISASQPWSLPLVTMFHQSQLPNLRKFHYRVSTSDPRTIELLAVLFKHLPDLEEASPKLDPQVQNYETLLPFIRASSLEISPINTAALDYLSPYTNELRIHASVASVRPADLWSLLEELLHRNGNIRTVHLNQYEFLGRWNRMKTGISLAECTHCHISSTTRSVFRSFELNSKMPTERHCEITWGDSFVTGVYIY